MFKEMNTTRALIVAAVIVALGLIVKWNVDDRAASEKQRDEHQRAAARTQAMISELAKRTNADATWEDALKGSQKVRIDPVLTIELERLWLADRPVLFIGLISDVNQVDSTRYNVRIERAFYRRLRNIFTTEFHLRLTCSKEKIDSLLSDPRLKFPENLRYGIPFVAKITEIRTEQDGSSKDVRVGVGECVEIGPVVLSDDA